MSSKPTIHLVSLPHTATTKQEYGQCAFTQKCRKFANMMTSLGYPVILYASDRNDANVAELVTCITKEEQDYYLGDFEWYQQKQWYKDPFSWTTPHWKVFTDNFEKGLKERLRPGDLICYTVGPNFRWVMSKSLSNKNIEYGIGYPSITTTPYKVFESWAWRHFQYARHHVPEFERQYNETIPNYFELEDFPYQEKKEDYLLFMARPIPAKGITTVMTLAAAGHKIKVAGAQKFEGKNIEYVGYADAKLRAELMGKAKALLSPTLYVGPFEGVTVEANLCGTPVITTPWGCYSETVQEGFNGFKANNLKETQEAIAKLDTIKPKNCRTWGEKYSTEVVKYQYDRYFDRISS